MVIASSKDPVKVEAGRMGARARWGGERRIVRLDDLSLPQRRLVLALVAAFEKAATVSESSAEQSPEAA